MYAIFSKLKGKKVEYPYFIRRIFGAQKFVYRLRLGAL